MRIPVIKLFVFFLITSALLGILTFFSLSSALAQSVDLQIPIGETKSIPICSDGVCHGIALYIVEFAKWLIAALSLLAVTAIMFGGIWWLTAAGNSKKVSEAKKIIMDSLVGLGIAIGSYLLLSVISPDLVNFKEIGVGNIDSTDYDLEIGFDSDGSSPSAPPSSEYTEDIADGTTPSKTTTQTNTTKKETSKPQVKTNTQTKNTKKANPQPKTVHEIQEKFNDDVLDAGGGTVPANCAQLSSAPCDNPSANNLVAIPTIPGISITGGASASGRAYIHKDAVEALKKAATSAHAQGYELSIFSACRPIWYQKKLYNNRPTDKKTGKRVESVAKPGCSNHEYGKALDMHLIDKKNNGKYSTTPIEDKTRLQCIINKNTLEGLKKLSEIMYTAGFARLTFESWHFEYLGGGGSRCRSTSCTGFASICGKSDTGSCPSGVNGCKK